MSMRRAFLRAMVLMALPGVALAQQAPAGRQTGPGVVSGTVVAEEGGAPVVGATIAVRRMADSTLVGGRITDREGRFRVENLPAGGYLVEVRSVGRAPRVERDVALSAEAPTRDLGTIRLAAVAVQVQGVTAQGQRSAVVIAPDRSIYSVRDMPLTQGAMAMDALRTIPEVEVDFEDQITARGGSPAIYIDGRPATMQGEALTNFLRSIRADRVDRVEYIPNPSASFDSEGRTGVVNIVLRRDASLGLSGTLSGNAGTRGSQGSSLRLNFQDGRLTIFGGGSVNLSDAVMRTADLRENRVVDPITFLEQETRQTRENRSGSTDLVAEWRLSSRGTVWGSGRASWNHQDRTVTEGYIQRNSSQVATTRWEQLLDGYQTGRSFGGSVGYRYVVQPLRNEFSTELRYGSNWMHNGTDYDRNTLLPATGEFVSELLTGENDGYHDDGSWSFQADLSRPIGAASKIDLGYRANFRDNEDENFLVETPFGLAPAFDEHVLFEHVENFHAAYVNLERRFGKVTAQGGLRGELADTRVEIPTEGDRYDNDYDQLYPSANVSYDHGGGKQLRLSYSRRVQRPTSGVLNPINLSSSDPFNRSQGNPTLGPQFAHSISLDPSWSGQLGTLRASTFVFWLQELWDRTRAVDAAGVSTMRWENVGSVLYGGGNLNAQLRQWGPLSGSVGVNAIRAHLEAASGTNTSSFTSTFWGTNANAMVRFSPTLTLQGQASYFPVSPSAQGQQRSTVYSTVALRQQLMENKVSVNLAILDPFDVYRTRFTTNDANHQQAGRTNPSQRRATLTVSYNFGRTPQSNRRTVQDEAGGTPTMGGGDIR